MTGSDQLLADLRTTAQGIQNKDWLSAGMGGAETSLDILGETGSPLSSLANAGLGWVTGLVSFLEEPLNQLRGDPGSVTSSADGFQSAHQQTTSLADSYRQNAGTQTSSWSGTAADGYQSTSSQLSDGISAIGQASTAVSSATSGGAQAVAQTCQTVTGLINQAVGEIVPIATQAIAAAPATGGASIAAAIPQVIQIAVTYGQQISAELGKLLSNSQALMFLVQTALQTLSAVTKLLGEISSRVQPGSSASSDTSTATTTA